MIMRLFTNICSSLLNAFGKNKHVKNIPVGITWFDVDKDDAGKLLSPISTTNAGQISDYTYSLLNKKYLLVTRLVNNDTVHNSTSVTVLKGISLGTCLHVLTDRITVLEKSKGFLLYLQNVDVIEELKEFKIMVQALQSLSHTSKMRPFVTFYYPPKQP